MNKRKQVTEHPGHALTVPSLMLKLLTVYKIKVVSTSLSDYKHLSCDCDYNFKQSFIVLTFIKGIMNFKMCSRQIIFVSV